MAPAKGTTTGYKVVHIKEADVHIGTFQRPLDEARVERIARAFDWALFRPLTIASNSVDYLVDGQHTFAALKWLVQHDAPKAKRLAINLSRIPAHVTPVRDEQEAAGRYVLLNTSTEKLTALEIYYGELVMEDPTALAVRDSVAAHGLQVGKKQGVEHIAAIGVLKALAESGQLDLILDITVGLWPTKKGLVDPVLKQRTEGAFLKGWALYLKRRKLAGDTGIDFADISIRASVKRIHIGGLKQVTTPLSILAQSSEMSMQSMITGGPRASSGNQAEWVAHSIGRALHGKKEWTGKYSGR